MSLAQVPKVVCAYVKQVVHVPFWTVGQEEEVVAQTLVKKRRVVNNKKKSICVLFFVWRSTFGGVVVWLRYSTCVYGV
jgi:hypothetical protein